MNVALVGDARLSIGSVIRDQLVGKGHHVFPLACDVRSEQEVVAAFSLLRVRNIDALVYAAGIYTGSRVESMKLEDWNNVLAVNLTGAMLCCREYVKRGNKGTIVLIGASAHHLPAAGSAAYCISKGGMAILTNILAQECGPDVNVIQLDPGIVSGTGMYKRTQQAMGLTERAMLNKRLATIPANRPMDRVEVAEWVEFLLTKGTYATGTCLKVDGGKYGFSNK